MKTCGSGIGAVVADIVEQHRGPGAGALRQPRDGAELDIPIDFGVDTLQFAGVIERLDPIAHVAERDRLSFCGHGLSGIGIRVAFLCTPKRRCQSCGHAAAEDEPRAQGRVFRRHLRRSLERAGRLERLAQDATEPAEC